MRKIIKNIYRFGINPKKYIMEKSTHIIHHPISKYPGFRQVDLVDFDSIKLFMFKNDNLYTHAVPDHRKRQDPKRFAETLRNGDAVKAVPSIEDARTTRNPQYIIEAVLAHCWDSGVSAVFLDIGANTGLIGLRIARYAEQSGEKLEVCLFEPGSSARLAAWNIDVNELADRVQLRTEAVSDYSGMAIMHTIPGSSDGDRLTDESANSVDHVVPTVDILGLLKAAAGDNRVALVKLDTEGLEPMLIARLESIRETFPTILFFEYMPWRYDTGKAGGFFEKLSETHSIYDLGYLPNPWHVRPIPKDELKNFEEEVRNRRFGYTDIMAIPDITPGRNALCERLSSFREKPEKNLNLAD